MMDALGADGQLVNAYEDYAPRAAHRPITKYEQRARDAGRDVVDLMFHRTMFPSTMYHGTPE
jgi:tRNA (guanine-N7-)-methyltransferase